MHRIICSEQNKSGRNEKLLMNRSKVLYFEALNEVQKYPENVICKGVIDTIDLD